MEPKVPVGKPKKFGLATVVLLVALLLTAGLIMFVLPRPHDSGEATPSSASSSPLAPAPQQPEFVRNVHHTYTFGDQIFWISTGTDGGALCVNVSAKEGNYTVYNQDGKVDDGTGSQTQAMKGFQAPKGETRAVTVWKADTPADCSKTETQSSGAPIAPAPASSCIAHVVMSNRIQAEWPELAIPANGDSAHIPVCGGLKPIFTNEGYEIHVVYRNNPKECIMGKPLPSCPNGDVVEEYLHDTTGKDRTERYAFERIEQR